MVTYIYYNVLHSRFLNAIKRLLSYSFSYQFPIVVKQIVIISQPSHSIYVDVPLQPVNVRLQPVFTLISKCVDH